jgi:DDE superfamily endonuclease
LLSQDAARFPLTPTLRTTLGVKGHRPIVGTWDNKDRVDGYAACNGVSGPLTTRLVEQPARQKQKTGQSKTQRLPAAFVAHLCHIARASPAESCQEVAITIDNAPWHRGVVVDEVLANSPHLRLYRLPSYSPQLKLVERFWRLLRRRATHHRLLTTRAELRHTLRQNICYYQSMRQKVLSLIQSKRKKS